MEGGPLHEQTFYRQQKTTYLTLWFAYTLFYFGRLNYAVAMPVMRESLGWTTETLGYISTAFFWVYAVGQLVNGYLGDRVSCRWFVFFGLTGSAAANLLFGFGAEPVFLVIIWGLNGYFQSTGWGPIVRVASLWVTGDKSRLIALLGTTIPAGFFLSWLVSRQLLLELPGQWPVLFWLPAGVLAVMGIVWVWLIRDFPPGADSNQQAPVVPRLKGGSRLLPLRSGWILMLLGLVSVLQGMVKDGINLWTPTILVESYGAAVPEAAAFSLMLPVLSFFGVLLGRRLGQGLGGEETKVIVVLYLLTAILAFAGRAVLHADTLWAAAAILGLCQAGIYGINVQLMMGIPMRFAAEGQPSTLAGFLDFASYVGAGLMGLSIGPLRSFMTWGDLLALAGVLCVAGAGLTLLVQTRSKDGSV